MSFEYYLPFLLWWLLIIAMASASVLLIGFAVIRWAIEREELDK